MTSKRIKGLPEIAQPKTKHEEIMLCIESTNDIVSKLLEHQEKVKGRRRIAMDLLEKFINYIEGEIGKQKE